MEKKFNVKTIKDDAVLEVVNKLFDQYEENSNHEGAAKLLTSNFLFATANLMLTKLTKNSTDFLQVTCGDKAIFVKVYSNQNIENVIGDDSDLNIPDEAIVVIHYVEEAFLDFYSGNDCVAVVKTINDHEFTVHYEKTQTDHTKLIRAVIEYSANHIGEICTSLPDDISGDEREVIICT